MKNEQIYWKMRNGQMILVDQMTESHAKNTLKMVLRRIREWQKEIKRTNPRYEFGGELFNEHRDQIELMKIDPELICSCDQFHICQVCDSLK
jgi:hypothetical protein